MILGVEPNASLEQIVQANPRASSDPWHACVLRRRSASRVLPAQTAAWPSRGAGGRLRHNKALRGSITIYVNIIQCNILL